ncbi:hypothetical protein [Neobacillus muris]|uniref:hypothetical protein n=1 Tax=Neobacillus muris TaxID=2941334 RepID=UPI00203D0535|nr:hypothetical protein [Neobacillus muris]
MVTTNLPTKSEYENAVAELRKLNNELFYDDFKEKIKQLESHFAQLEDLKQEIQVLLATNKSEIVENNQQFLEDGQARLLAANEELQQRMALFTEKTNEVHQAAVDSNKNVLEKAMVSIGTVSESITDFLHKVTEANEKYQTFLSQNETFVSLAKEQLLLAEEKMGSHVKELQELENRLEELQQAYEGMFQKHTESIKSIMVVREEAFVDKITHQMENWTAVHAKFNENLRFDFEQWQNQLDSFIKRQNDEMLQTISENMVSKEEFFKAEKKNQLRSVCLISVMIVEAVLIGISFFM